MTTLWDKDGKAWRVGKAERTVRNPLFKYLSFQGDGVQSGAEIQSGVWRNRLTRLPEMDGVIAAGERMMKAKPSTHELDPNETVEIVKTPYPDRADLTIRIPIRPIADEVPEVPSDRDALKQLVFTLDRREALPDDFWDRVNEQLKVAKTVLAADGPAGEIGEKADGKEKK